jgi:dienelactone hydrolase
MRKLIILALLLSSASVQAFWKDNVAVYDPRLNAAIEIPVDKFLVGSPAPTIIYGHGCGGVWPHDDDKARLLRSWGYNVLVINSFKPRNVEQNCEKKNLVSNQQRVLDAVSITEWAKKQKWHQGKIGYFGVSQGGESALAIASWVNDRTFDAIVALYPWCNPKHNPIINIPMQIHIGADDSWTPARQCDYYKQFTNFDMHEYQNTVHGYERPGPVRYSFGHKIEYNAESTRISMQKTKAFFDKHLKENNG